MEESRLELKVGALLLAALLGGLGLLTLMGELSFSAGNERTVDFSHTGNVVKGAPVKLGGVPVGRVEKIELLPTRRDTTGEPLPVKMTVSLQAAAAESLRTDAAFTVSSQGPLGEPYLEVWPGIASGPADAKASIRGIDSPRIDIVSNRLAKFLEQVSNVLDRDPEALNKLVTGVGGLTTTVDGVISENREEIRGIAKELSVAAKDLRALAATAKTQFEPGGKAAGILDDAAVAAKLARTELPELSKKANIALGGVANVTGQFTEEDGQRLKAMLVRYQQAGEKLDVMATKADKILTKIEKGEGTFGAAVQDKQLFDDLKELLSDLRKHPWKLFWKD